jgi:LmbE family N-acetylglucosaminyl deacetylase
VPSGQRIVVVSPHLDDGVLSLGASIASWARQGSRVELLTVFACDPESDAPAGGWDARGGFRTEGEAARARRGEDRRACELLGAAPTWLGFGSLDYERHADDASIRAAIFERLDGADELFLPGSPLTHPDHLWLWKSLHVMRPDGRIVYYAEQPYTRRSMAAPAAFESVETSVPDRFAKWRAIRQYRSQLPLLAMRRSLTRGAHVIAFSAEKVSRHPATLPQR